MPILGHAGHIGQPFASPRQAGMAAAKGCRGRRRSNDPPTRRQSQVGRVLKILRGPP
jgi:hypothetical protein